MEKLQLPTPINDENFPDAWAYVDGKDVKAQSKR